MPAARVLCVDDDPVALKVLARHLERAGARTFTLTDPTETLSQVREHRPHLVMLDANMPQLDGYAVAEQLRRDPVGRALPLIFVTASDSEVDRRRALALGAADFLTKPVTAQQLVATAHRHLVAAYPQARPAAPPAAAKRPAVGRYLAEGLALAGDEAARMMQATGNDAYRVAELLQVSSAEIAQLLAKYANVPYLATLAGMPRNQQLLTEAFCRERQVALIEAMGGVIQVVVANPLDLELLDLVRSRLGERRSSVAVTDPGQLAMALTAQDDDAPVDAAAIADHLLRLAVGERASDIHIEPKEELVVVNMRVDGEIRAAMTLSHIGAVRLVSRMKLAGDLDIAERRRPQDGSCLVKVSGREFKLRLATAPTPHGESLTIRILAADASVPNLDTLGMMPDQSELLRDLILRNSGMILIVGTTGSGKSTTSYSLLANLENKARSVLTIEDPVEYRIPFANQQQVNEKAGVTFATLLRAAVRQDPDVLFLGEVRDPESAQTAAYMASTGHLTVATMHTADAASAVSRLERLGVDRRTLADSLLGLVAQRLVKRLCTHCRQMVEPTPEQVAWFARLSVDTPERIAVAPGCEACGGRGHRGRVGVYEILAPDMKMLEQLRCGSSVPEIRGYLLANGFYLMGHHALDLLRAGVIGIDTARDVVGSSLV